MGLRKVRQKRRRSHRFYGGLGHRRVEEGRLGRGCHYRYSTLLTDYYLWYEMKSYEVVFYALGVSVEQMLSDVRMICVSR